MTVRGKQMHRGRKDAQFKNFTSVQRLKYVNVKDGPLLKIIVTKEKNIPREISWRRQGSHFIFSDPQVLSFVNGDY